MSNLLHVALAVAVVLAFHQLLRLVIAFTRWRTAELRHARAGLERFTENADRLLSDPATPCSVVPVIRVLHRIVSHPKLDSSVRRAALRGPTYLVTPTGKAAGFLRQASEDMDRLASSRDDLFIAYVLAIEGVFTYSLRRSTLGSVLWRRILINVRKDPETAGLVLANAADASDAADPLQAAAA